MKKIFIISCLILAGLVAKAQTTLLNALYLLQQKNYVAALDICNTLLDESAENSSVLGVRSQIYAAMGNNDMAMEDAEKALSIDNTSDRALFAKAELFFMQKDYSQALQYYETAITVNANMAEAYAGKARVMVGMQNQKEAMNVVENALKKLSADSELYYMRGLLNYQRGKFKLAIEDYDRALSNNANWNAYQIFLNRGIANDALGKPDLAVQDFTRAIIADPNATGGYIARGNIQYNSAKYKEAAEDFKKAEVLNPDNAVVIYNIGMALFKDDDRSTACKYFQKACLLGNTNACKMIVLNCSDRKIN